MKLVRYGKKGQECPGILDDDGQVRSLAGLYDDLHASALESIAGTEWQSAILDLPVCPPDVRIGAPIRQPGKIVCIGLNYKAHAKEAGLAIPDEPIVFLKAPNSLTGPFDPVVLPANAAKCDWEVELGIVIGREAKNVSQREALDYVFGYCVVNDVSERAFQLERGGQWTKGKSADTFCPVGPYLVTRDEIPDPQALRLRCTVGKEKVQDSSTSDMIFPVAKIISYLSSFMTLQPGDLICTGTPPGVGHGQKPPRYLKEGDFMTLSIDGLGTQRSAVIAERRDATH